MSTTSSGLMYIGAASPLIGYSPRPYALGSDGASIHGGQGSLTIDLEGMYFSQAVLYWQASSAFQISLGIDGTLNSGSSSTGATLTATYGQHDLRLEAACDSNCTNQVFTLNGVVLTTLSTGSNATLDDASSQIAYSGFTSDTVSTSSIDAIRHGQFYQDTVSYTSSSGASMSFSFVVMAGTALYIFGPTGPSFGTFQIEIDSVSSKASFNASTTQNTYDTLLYYISGLYDGTHQFKLASAGGGIVAFDYAVAVSSASESGSATGTAEVGTSSPSATSVFPTPQTRVGSRSSNGAAGGAIGATLGILAAIFFGWIAWRYYRYKKAGGNEPFLAALCGARNRPPAPPSPEPEQFKLWPMISFKPKYAT